MGNDSNEKNLSAADIALITIGIILYLAAFAIREFYSGSLGNIMLICLFLAMLIIVIIYERKNKDNKESSKERVKSGLFVIQDSIYAFQKYPKLLLPLFFVWLVYAPTILYLKFFLPWKEYSFLEQVEIVAVVIFGFSFLLTLSCLVLLELLQQQEMGKRMSIIKATPAIFKDFLKALPIAILWAIIWLILTIIDAILSRFRGEDDEGAEFSPEAAAETLAGFEHFSLSGAFIEALKKGVRMIVFLMLPAIAWEKKSTIRAFKKGTAIAKTHFVEFMTGFVSTELAAVVVFLPPTLMFMTSRYFHIHFPDEAWYIAIVYIGFAWSFCFFLEQMFTAGLYLWHLHWATEYISAKQSGRPLPKLSEVRRPILLDDVPDFLSLKRKIQRIIR